jgi:hypothetical protein
LVPLVERIRERILLSELMWTDDTPVRMRTPGEGRGTCQARFWTYIGDESHPYDVYDFTRNRTRDGPSRFLKD